MKAKPSTVAQDQDRPEAPTSPQGIAYALWCLQENRRLAGQPLAPLDELIQSLRTRHPALDAADLQRGLDLFLAQTGAEILRSCATHDRLLWMLHRSGWQTPQGHDRRAAPTPSSVSMDCTALGVSRYNGQKGCACTPNDSPTHDFNPQGTLIARKPEKRRP